MITNKQFDEYILHIKKLLFEGNDVYIHGKKVVRTQLSNDDQMEYRFSKESKIWTKNPGIEEYVTYSKDSFNNDTKLHRLYDVTQTIKNDHTYMEAKLAFEKYEELYDVQDSENWGDGYSFRNDGVSEK